MRFLDYVALAFRSLRRSRLRSGLTISAIVVGATGVTIMLTFVTSVKSYVVKQFVDSGQIRQIQVSETPNLTYSPTGLNAGGPPQQGGTPVLTAALEAKIGRLSHVTGVAATLDVGGLPVQYVTLGSHQLAVHGIYAYQADGVIAPPIVAGRGLDARDNAGAILVSQGYADALGFKGSYPALVNRTVELHMAPGYTGVGATLPDLLPPQHQCDPAARDVSCGPTSGLPAVTVRAAVIGVVGKAFNGGQSVFLPMPWAIAIFDQAQPRQVQYDQSAPSPAPCPGGPCASATPPAPSPGGGPPGPPSGPGHVRGGWVTQPAAQFVASQGGYRTIIASVDDTNALAAVANAIDRFGVSTATGLDALDQKKHAADVVGLVLGALGMVALGIAALGVMNTMVMSVLERTREIGVMRALGARRSTIRRLFTFEAAGLGFCGGLVGVVIGYVFVLVARPVISNAVKSDPKLGASVSVPLWLVVVVITGTTLIGFVSGLLPARRAARLDPVEALRYE